MQYHKNNIKESFDHHKDWGRQYFLPWTYEHPLLISQKTNEKVAQLQKILYKIIRHFIENYGQYEHLMPLKPETKRVLSFFKNKEYQVGSYRTDFVIDEQLQFKLIEITCRFAFNGFFLSGYLDNISKEYAQRNSIDHQSSFKHFLSYLDEQFLGKEIIILSHKGKSESSRFYQKILIRAGYKVDKINLEEAESHLSNVEHKIVITELNQEDYYLLSDKLLSQLAKANIFNDLRTVFLIHDKRFFSILTNNDIQQKILHKEEINLLNQFCIPTYSYGQSAEQWQIAKTQKNNWILKHRSLGKSAKVFAGIVTKEKEWQQLFNSKEIEDMILQPFVKQKKFNGKIGTKIYNDYVVGTMLFFEDYYFGLGLFRASSHPVSNVVDDRKVMHLNIKATQNTDNYYLL